MNQPLADREAWPPHPSLRCDLELVPPARASVSPVIQRGGGAGHPTLAQRGPFACHPVSNGLAQSL